jgi:hypothetical protein
MTHLAAFLTERLDEDEQLARTADAEPFPDKGFPRGTHIAYGLQSTGLGLDYQGFALVWDPARVLAEIEAKRQLLAEIEGITFHTLDGQPDPTALLRPAGRMLRALAAPYADHEDFDESWRT